MCQVYQPPSVGDNHQNNQIVIDQKLLELKDTIRPGRSRVYVDVDLDMRLRLTHLPGGDIEVTLEKVPDLSNLISKARTLSEFREMEVTVFGPHTTAQDDLAWRKGGSL